jgi:3-methyladenine DNA glycosylase AlkD
MASPAYNVPRAHLSGPRRGTRAPVTHDPRAGEVKRLARELSVLGDPIRAAGAKAYLKSELAFLGVRVPDVRALARRYTSERTELEGAPLFALVDALWATRVHEQRSLAIAILEHKRATLALAHMERLRALVRDADTWAHVDWLAIKVVGALVERDTCAADALDGWAVDPSFWVRRAALLALHDPILRGAGDVARFTRLCVPMLAEREFFIRKAIGWVLRSMGRRNPAAAIAFVRAHARALSALSFREATRLLPERDRRALTRLREGAA